MESQMRAKDAIFILKLLQRNHIEVIVDGGWGVDALLGRQTRKHKDLDIAIDHDDAQKIRGVLELEGFKEIPRDDSHEFNFVFGDESGRWVDIHTFHFDESGRLTKGLDYPLDSLNGAGMIDDYPVRCISPEWMVKFHSGYRLDINDYRDVKALCEQFGYELPKDFAPFKNGKTVI